MSKIKLGIVGAGEFLATGFLPVFMAHPGIGDIYIADHTIEKARGLVDKHKLAGAFASLEEILNLGVDAVAVFTSRHTHAPLALQAMRAGAHVYIAVPAAVALDELEEMVATATETRRICMTGETSYYYPEAIYCREEFATGRWGAFVHADAQYIHDMATFGPHFKPTYGDRWKRFATIPPMHYATHSFSIPLSITGARVTKIAAFGFRDPYPDSGFDVGANEWDNTFSNEVALAQTSDGGTIRVGEFRRLGWFAQRASREVMMPTFYCTDACFEENSGNTTVTVRRGSEGGQHWEHEEKISVDLGPWVDGPYFERPQSEDDKSRFLGLAPAHDAGRLPREFMGVKTGHNGSHHFLVDDFVRGCFNGELPPCHIWASAAWAAPGIVAHESANKGGVLLPVPDFGAPPADWPLLRLPSRPSDPRRPVLPSLTAPGGMPQL